MRFNEAGPQGAGKPDGGREEETWGACFNEAGPQGAGKPNALRTCSAEWFSLQ